MTSLRIICMQEGSILEVLTLQNAITHLEYFSVDIRNILYLIHSLHMASMGHSGEGHSGGVCLVFNGTSTQDRSICANCGRVKPTQAAKDGQ